MKTCLILLFPLVISGCSSFGKGVASAFFEKQAEQEDTRVCQVFGDSFAGIKPKLINKRGHNKVLMVHGVGHHDPGYSTEFLEKLAKELGLTMMSRAPKELSLTDPLEPDKDLGTLIVRRLTNADQSEELLYYELSWSAISAPEKTALKYDNSGEYSYRRADINNKLKEFANDTGPDPFVYFGDKHEDILISFRQSFCWMVSSDWDNLPAKSKSFCDPLTEHAIHNIDVDTYAIVSHSLGSRITIDGIQSLINIFNDDDKSFGKPEMKVKMIQAFKNQQLQLYMLSNQLPILQMGQQAPEVTNQYASYCLPDGQHYEQRTLNKTSIIAFSDPNDLLSYAIPNDYLKTKIDSRFCAEITNININIANVVDLLGLGSIANPLTAHTGYDSDDRVVALIAKGIGAPDSTALIQERCEWVKLLD